MDERSEGQPAGIEYAGLPGITRACSTAVLRILQFGEFISQVRILTCRENHGLLLLVNGNQTIGVKSGFRSGYTGAGASGLSSTLALLESHGSDIDEVEVQEDLLSRLDRSALMAADLEGISEALPVQPTRWIDYISESDHAGARQGKLWASIKPVIPYGIIDPRLMDLAHRFCEEPDGALLTGYRRLEDTVRERTGLVSDGARLYSDAFAAPEAPLEWPDCDKAQTQARRNLFAGCFSSYRNPRAHRELKSSFRDLLREFLLLNHLFVLESKATGRLSRDGPGARDQLSVSPDDEEVR